MPCVLSDSSTLDADFQGKVGDAFTIRASASAGLAAIAAASYGGITITKAGGPLTFTIVSGVRSLATIIEGSVLNSVIKLQEQCAGGGTKTLRQLQLTDPDHTTCGVRIKGV